MQIGSYVVISRCFALLAGILLLMPSESGFAARKYAIDFMNLATVLLYDGEYEKAREALEQVNPEDFSYDKARYESVEGLIYLREGEHEAAARKLSQAIFSTRLKKYEFDRNTDQEVVRRRELEELHQYYAEALYHLDRCEEVLEALDAAAQVSWTRPQLVAVRSDCYWRTGFHDSAIETLNNGFRKFPDALQFMRQKFYYYIEGGLYIGATELAEEFLNEDDFTVTDYLSFAKALDGASQTDQAIALLQKARALFPENAEIPLFLGHIYLRQEQLNTAAGLFELAAMIDQKYIAEAAEVYRRAGHFPTALRLNSAVRDTSRKLLQQVAIYIELEEFERIVALTTGT